jgi:hypothetical protein
MVIAVGRHEVIALGIIGLAIALRIALIALGWPHLNADEGTMGLMALHIAYRGEHPVFFYGQSYMGGLEAYMGAALFRLLGASDFSLRLGLVILFSLFLVCIYLLVSRLYGKDLALFSLAVLSLGSERMLFRQLQAIGGYMETLFFGALVLLLATRLCLTADGAHPPSRGRLIAYGGWGLAVGLGLWSDLLILTLVAAAALLLGLFCRAELRGRAGLALLLGLILGASPLIAYTAGQGRSPLTVALSAYRAATAGDGGHHASLGQGIVGTMLVSLPISTGGNALCSLSPGEAWPLSRRSSAHVVQCTVVHGAWSTGLLALWMIAVLSAAVSLRTRWRRRAGHAWSEHERREVVRTCARLALLGSAALIFLLYLVSPAARFTPWYSARYLTPLWIALPAVLAPLLAVTIQSVRRLAFALHALQRGTLGVLVCALVIGTTDTFSGVRAVQSLNGWQQGFVAGLLRIGAVHIYTDYWTCDRVAFQSREHVLCSVLGTDLQSGENRYPAYRTIVSSDGQASYAFPDGSAQLAAFASRIGHSSRRYRRLAFNGYVVYQPIARATAITSADAVEQTRHLSRRQRAIAASHLACPKRRSLQGDRI